MKSSFSRFVRSARILTLEVLGLCSVQEEGLLCRSLPGQGLWRGLRTRWRNLLSRDPVDYRHPLFSADYYLAMNPELKRQGTSPLLHFLIKGGFEGRQPHPLFDPKWYLERYPDVVASGLNPLQHYAHFGWREMRSPHPLFDPKWYLCHAPDVKRLNQEPVLHFLEFGDAEDRDPHPLFATRWYKDRYPEARETWGNSLVHYVECAKWHDFDPNPGFQTGLYRNRYPSAWRDHIAPLVHFLTTREPGTYDPHPDWPCTPSARAVRPVEVPGELRLPAPATPRPDPGWRNPAPTGAIPVFVVYGAPNVGFLESQLIPALAGQGVPLHLHTLHYRNPACLLSPAALTYSGGALTGITDWSSTRENTHIGFGEAMNYLFARVAPENCFFLVNPDSLPMEGAMERLLHTYRERNAALVEARQWPNEHPKEYDPATGFTPWASGAFLLVSSAAFARLEGFDPVFFLYSEDVDLSWRAWMEGMPVVYEPAAGCAHFTGGLSYHANRFYPETFYGLRSFLLIAYKYFGRQGELAAWRWIDQAKLPPQLAEAISTSYLAVRDRIRPVDTAAALNTGRIKILGLNLYHQLRREVVQG